MIFNSTGVIVGAATWLATTTVIAPAAPLVASVGIGIATALSGFALFVKAPKGSNTRTPEGEVAEIDSSVTVPNELGEQLKTLQAITKLHAKSVNSELMGDLNQVIYLTQELFKRIESKSETQAHRMAAVNYTHTLKKLNKAIGEEYYLDIVEHPTLWDDPQKRLNAVAVALVSTRKQLLTNIKRVNASQDIDYEVVLNSLTTDFSEPLAPGLVTS